MKEQTGHTMQPVSGSDNDPQLSGNISRNAGYMKVPDGYFDNLPEEIMNLIGSQEKQGRLKKLSVAMSSRSFYLPAAAMAAIALLLVTLVKRPAATSAGDLNTELSMAIDPTYAYEEMLIESGEIENMIDQNEAGNGIDFLNSSVSSDDIANYLSEQEIDTDLLTEN